MKIGIIRESMRYEDPRVALTPAHARRLMDQFPGLEIVVQSSSKRIFNDHEYLQFHIPVVKNVDDCDLLIGVKEVAIQKIIPGKKYLFFAHVAKQQSKQIRYFQELSKKGITLIDYEYLKDEKRRRIIAFGYWAGIAGCYYAIHALTKKLGLSELPDADELDDISMFQELLNARNFPSLKFLITGTGRTAKGAEHVLRNLGVQKVSPENFLLAASKPVYTLLKRVHHIVDQNGRPYAKLEFQKQKTAFHSILNTYAASANVYLACHYWEPGFPIFLNNEDLKTNQVLKIIADISCDIPGPLASSLRESTHAAPYYDYDPETNCEKDPFSSEKHITIMAISNLPAQLPREASIHFSTLLHREILPYIIKNERSAMIDEATILNQGKLTKQFSYLYNYLNQIR